MTPAQRRALEAVRDGRGESAPQHVLIRLWEEGLIEVIPPYWCLRLSEAGREALGDG